MLLDIEPQAVANGDFGSVMRLLQLIILGQHKWHETLHSATAVDDFVRRNEMRIRYPALAELAVKAVEEAGFGRAVPDEAVKITFVDLEALVSDLDQPAYVVVEDGIFEQDFLQGLARAFGRAKLVDAAQRPRPWLVFENAAGKARMRQFVANRRRNFRVLVRVAAILDSDARLPGEPHPENRTIAAEILAIDGIVGMHMWECREAENYLPKAVLEHHHPHRKNQIDRVFRIPEQRRHADFKKEIGRTRAPDVFPRDLSITRDHFAEDVRAELDAVLSMIERIL